MHLFRIILVHHALHSLPQAGVITTFSPFALSTSDGIPKKLGSYVGRYSKTSPESLEVLPFSTNTRTSSQIRRSGNQVTIAGGIRVNETEGINIPECTTGQLLCFAKTINAVLLGYCKQD
jgi:hypothetical protein